MKVNFDATLFNSYTQTFRRLLKDDILVRGVKDSLPALYESLVTKCLRAEQANRGTAIVDCFSEAGFAVSVKTKCYNEMKNLSENYFCCFVSKYVDRGLEKAVDEYYRRIDDLCREVFEIQVFYNSDTLYSRVYAASLKREHCDFRTTTQQRLYMHSNLITPVCTSEDRGIKTFDVEEIERMQRCLFD